MQYAEEVRGEPVLEVVVVRVVGVFRWLSNLSGPSRPRRTVRLFRCGSESLERRLLPALTGPLELLRNHAANTEAGGQTFVFFFAGFQEPAEGSGLEKLHNEIQLDRDLAGLVLADVIGWPSGRFPGPQFRSARDQVDTFLREHDYSAETDSVVLVGYSFGGQIAWKLARDVQGEVRGRDPAEGLVTFDPVDWKSPLLPLPHAVPRGMEGTDVLNFIQRNPDATDNLFIYGYTIRGVEPSELGRGPDNTWGTSDDTTHFLIDDDLGQDGSTLGIYSAILSFLRRKPRKTHEGRQGTVAAIRPDH